MTEPASGTGTSSLPPLAEQPGKKAARLSFSLHRSSGWRVVIALGCTTIVSYRTTQYLFGVLEVPLATDFGWSRVELSGAYALSLLVAGILGVPVGYLVDRFGARGLMTVGSVLAGGALIGLSQLSTLSRFLAALDQASVEHVRTLFQQDLFARHPFADPVGITDRCAQSWLIADVDGTRKVARQRALPQTESLPAPHRR